MKVRLKDHARQELMDRLFHGELSKMLDAPSGWLVKSLQLPEGTPFSLSIGHLPGDPVPPSNGRRARFFFFPEEFEIVESYDPEVWNSYPKIEPPRSVPMRVETDRGLKLCASFDGHLWIASNGSHLTGVLRFKPWED